jgi:drug/metabolite transporter (DMT)-like permease
MNEDARGYKPPALLASGAVVFMCLIWGSTWFVIGEGIADVPPLTAAGWRFVLGGAGMAVVAHFLARREGGLKPPLWMTLYQGALNFAPSYALVYWAETVIPTGLVAVLWAVYPLFVAAAAHVWLPEERLHRSQALGFVAAFGGVGCLFVNDLSDIGPEALGYGALLLLSPLVSAIAAIVIKKHGAHVSSVQLSRNSFLVAGLCLLAGALLFERDDPVSWTPRAIFCLSYLTLFGTIIAFGLFWWLLRYGSAGKLSLIAYVVPVIALVIGQIAGERKLDGWSALGCGLVIAGVVLAVRYKKARNRNPQEIRS